MSNLKLSKYEQNIENNISGYKPVSPNKKRKIETLINRATEKKNISLRVNIHDLNLLKMRADQEGIPYQTLISSILHKYITEQLVDQRSIVQSMHFLKTR